MTPTPTDLFGEVPVTLADLFLWCTVIVPHVSPARLDYYIKNWDVAGKVKAAKIDGRFNTLHERLAERNERNLPARLSHLITKMY